MEVPFRNLPVYCSAIIGETFDLIDLHNGFNMPPYRYLMSKRDDVPCTDSHDEDRQNQQTQCGLGVREGRGSRRCDQDDVPKAMGETKLECLRR
jgi:hypothetical protein